ncbi:MAG: cysteine-rich small domain-containing protein [Lachnospiraceae bacterium]|nr:cysteine-rich small domain-containing protein [Lachnospiraceae bacterium]
MGTVNSSSFFANKDCRYYPCHECDEDINCLFCYCPLYTMDCPGDYVMTEKDGRQIKNCSACTFPHKAENYPEVIRLIKKL